MYWSSSISDNIKGSTLSQEKVTEKEKKKNKRLIYLTMTINMEKLVVRYETHYTVLIIDETRLLTITLWLFNLSWHYVMLDCISYNLQNTHFIEV